MLLKYERFVLGMALRIQRAMNRQDEFTRDDLLQEGKIALLQHIRSMDDESQIFLSKARIRGAMFTYMRSMSLVYIPANKFCKEVNRFSRDGNVDPESLPGDYYEEEWVLRIAYKQFLMSLPKEERLI